MRTYWVAVTRGPSPFTAPSISNLRASGSDTLTADFTWHGTAFHYIEWELQRAGSASGAYEPVTSPSASVDTGTDSARAVTLSGRTAGYYKLRGRVCDNQSEGASERSSSSSDNPNLTCGLWSGVAR